ncbi:MAG: DUF2336 domain-containing protein [Alphaproteobacteria bacterium]|nr:DUF2336 domain-containing protein [Alphaproteobacteria bacterium]
MIGQRPVITSSEVEALRLDRSPPRREAMAGKVAGLIDADLSERERALAGEILRRFVRDEIEAVRLAVAKAVASSPHLPADVARTLAGDVERVSLPILEFSPVLAEADLIRLLKDSSAAKATAIAARSTVSSAVADAVLETGHTGAIARLIGNAGAAISDTALKLAVERHGQDEAIGRAIVVRPALPENVRAAIERAAKAHVGSYLRRYLNLPESVIAEGLSGAPKPANGGDKGAKPAPAADTLPSLVPADETAESFARKLAYSGGISNENIMHALCTGERDFVETAISLRTSLSRDVVRQRLFSEDVQLRRSVLTRAGIIEEDIPVMLAVLEVRDIEDPVVYQMAAISAAAAAARNRSSAWSKVARKITKTH